MSELIQDVGEERLVSLILAKLREFQSETLIVQPGDDAAVLTQLAQPTITADILIEEVHFKTNWSSPKNIGRKAAAANLADLIAMGAKPVALTVSLGLPNSSDLNFVLDLITAIATEAAKVNAQVVGGDVTLSEKLVISISALGDCESRDPILRSGAKVGDEIGLIGSIGQAQAGLQLLRAGLAEPIDLIMAHREPNVVYAAGIDAWLAAHAMIDVSDGLIIDANRIATASNVKLDFDSKALRSLITPSFTEAGKLLKVDPIDFLLAGGEDHGFLFTASSLPAWAIRLGKVVSGNGVSLDQRPTEIKGFQHFSE